MSESTYWSQVEEVDYQLPGGFHTVETLLKVFGNRDILTPGDIEILSAMAAAAGKEDSENPYRYLIRAIEQHRRIRVKYR